MKTQKICVVFLVFVSFFTFSNAAKILGFSITLSRSHFIIHDSLMRGLAAKGHQVTMVNLFETNETIPNYRSLYIPIDEQDKAVMVKCMSNLLSSANNTKQSTFSMLSKIPMLYTSANDLTYTALTHPLIERLKETESFDLIAFGYFLNEFQLGLAGHFKCPSIVITGTPAIKNFMNLIGNPGGYSYTPSPILGFKEELSFSKRFLSIVHYWFEWLFAYIADYWLNLPYYSKTFLMRENYPTLDDVRKNVSLVLATQHFSQTGPVPLFPGMLEVSGMHIKSKPDPLPETIKEWLDTATDGAILFSLGSNVKSAELTSEKRSTILRVLAKFTKQKFIWKWEDDNLPGKPENVMISKWLPQDDILAHPNVKLFISHCGKGSINEAKYHGVPILGLPIFGDQINNLETIIAEGWSIPYSLAELNEESFYNAIKEMLENPKYRDFVKQEADLYKDRPQSPLETAIFWTEYVIRHKGAKHMQSQGVHMNFVQYYGLDVYALINLIFYIIYKLTKCFVIFFYRKCCCRKPLKNKIE